jgi:hypothetical protein
VCPPRPRESWVPPASRPRADGPAANQPVVVVPVVVVVVVGVVVVAGAVVAGVGVLSVNAVVEVPGVVADWIEATCSASSPAEAWTVGAVNAL